MRLLAVILEGDILSRYKPTRRNHRMELRKINAKDNDGMTLVMYAYVIVVD